MSVPLNLQDIDIAAKLAWSDLQQFMDDCAHRPELAPGTKRATDDELLALVNKMTQLYPPEPMVRPDGTQVNVSPWVEMLFQPWLLGGNDDAERLLRILRKGAWI